MNAKSIEAQKVRFKNVVNTQMITQHYVISTMNIPKLVVLTLLTHVHPQTTEARSTKADSVEAKDNSPNF